MVTQSAPFRIPRNDRRIALVIGSTASGVVRFYPNADDTTSGLKIPIAIDALPFMMTYADYGDLVRCGGYIAGGGGDAVAYIEVILDPCECLDKPDPNPWK